MNVKELKDYLDKIYAPDETIVVIPKDKELVEAGSYDFLYAEYKDFNTEEIKTNDVFVIY
jgi:hypothetical protein